MISYCLDVSPLIFPDKRHTMGLSSVGLALPRSLPPSPPSLSLPVSFFSSPPDVRYSGRVCAAGCRLTLFKTTITSFRLVLQLSTAGAPTDCGTHQTTETQRTHTQHGLSHDHRVEPLKQNAEDFAKQVLTCWYCLTLH